MPTDTKALARELMEAWSASSTIASPPSSIDADFNLDAAYATEAELRRMRAEAGHAVAGRKVGYANRAMWRVLKLDTLVWAAMYDDTVHLGALELAVAKFIAPRIEPEIVLKLKIAPAPGLGAEGVLECVEWMALGFEIIDCPWPGWQFKPADFVAAFGLHRALAVGEPRKVDTPGIADALAHFKLRLFRDGELVEEGAGKNSLKSPALCLAELASAAPLGAGEVISTGTLTGAQAVKPGEVWRAETEGLAISPLEVRFT